MQFAKAGLWSCLPKNLIAEKSEIIFQGSRKRLKVVGAQNQILLICGEIPEYSWVSKDFCGCKTTILKKVWVQLCCIRKAQLAKVFVRVKRFRPFFACANL